MHAMEMKMLRWMYGHTMSDMIRNEEMGVAFALCSRQDKESETQKNEVKEEVVKEIAILLKEKVGGISSNDGRRGNVFCGSIDGEGEGGHDRGGSDSDGSEGGKCGSGGREGGSSYGGGGGNDDYNFGGKKGGNDGDSRMDRDGGGGNKGRGRVGKKRIFVYIIKFEEFKIRSMNTNFEILVSTR
ncbi:heterogeneous nuclear ribonucleoprotein A3 homolog 2-like [Solanum pennellii]|uniref:Heterogeneous nuclear ribonucleoprotein A3 homolog 2-like n=1 Tax=Solanum pennellii TaxID=28526 RepID=A0ABM1H7C8_SOLPN|nr:heterogeneous nuclear ribonucleoprotein A3 homolog 2-like [Solanum pennellii]